MGIGADERAYTHEGWPGRLARKSAAVGYRRPRRAVARTAAAGPPRVVCLLVAASGAPAWFQPAMWPTDPPGARLDLVERQQLGHHNLPVSTRPTSPWPAPPRVLQLQHSGTPLSCRLAGPGGKHGRVCCGSCSWCPSSPHPVRGGAAGCYG
ncbi:hypothetical protein SEVIR_4G281401v4 [Setaria viridis]